MCKNQIAKMRILQDIAPIIYHRKFNPNKFQTGYEIHNYEKRSNTLQLY